MSLTTSTKRKQEQLTTALSLVDVCVSGKKRAAPEQSAATTTEEQPCELFRTKISVSESAPFSELWDKFEEAGFERPDYITCGGKSWDEYATIAQARPFDEIHVVEDGPSEIGKCINVDDTLIAYANLQYGRQIELNLSTDTSLSPTHNVDNLSDAGGLQIDFQRTTRMPDDDKTHQLPASLGSFPLHNVAAYADVLPDRIVRDGGVFMPMWQREALWIGLTSTRHARYALRFSIGRINAVTGVSMDEIPDESADGQQVQDYLVVPGQEWIDGICVAPGIVRQFVAMPLGSGYTVEGQKTGEEKHGGLQIEIVPAFEDSLRIWLKADDSPEDAEDLENVLTHKVLTLNEYHSPRELGLSPGTRVRIFPTQPLPRPQRVVSDVLRKFGPDCVFQLYYPDRDPYIGYASSCLSGGEFFAGRDSRRWSGATLQKSEHYAGKMAYERERLAEYVSLPGASAGALCHSQSAQSATMGTDLDEHTRTMFEPTSPSYSLNSFDEGPAYALADELCCDIEPAMVSNLTPTPHIATRDLKAMGLAAGGKLVQDIYRDSNPARIWNTTASRLVHVHILDPMSWEAVTHIVPPPPPIDTQQYAQDGGQFFVVEEQPDNRLDGGNFESVKSVSAMDKEKLAQTDGSLDPKTPKPCKCGIRMCDCVVRPCGHVFCNVCIREIDDKSVWMGRGSQSTKASGQNRRCLTCQSEVSWVAGFAAPMNLPGEESLRMRVPVNVLKVEDGRMAFRSIQRSRI